MDDRELDFDALEKVAREHLAEWPGFIDLDAWIATFDPPTVLKLIALARLAAAPEPLRVAGEEVERLRDRLLDAETAKAVRASVRVSDLRSVLALIEPSAGGGER